MSAFLCSDYHLSALAYYATRGARHALHTDGHYWNDPADVFRELRAENVKSVAYRYREDAESMGEGQLAGHIDIAPLVAIKACHCLAYQSCEHPEWEGSRAKKLLDLIETTAIRELPGYDAAPWGLDA